MEVAGQWRREWAGTAEYGKVTEGGVTRRVARAMEVLNASAPGTRVRVVRAAYHSSAGPGAPAASCLMHSSRRVITSGFNLMDPPSLPSKPLEISSTPLDSLPENNTEIENYKVTEPDDFDISEPSKWRSSVGGSSLRMPSEESSSTDNASIIDLDSRTSHKNIFRKYSYDSENSDVPSSRRSSSRVSPLLDAPVALSTLKYKSLLNNSNDWNNRRKSYSFEDTSPLDETIMHSNDTLAMESSTDSGICKSSEIVNDPDDRYLDRKDKKNDKHIDNFHNWLSKNRSNPFYNKGISNNLREHDVVIEHPLENKIALQSSGKVSITVPIRIETEDEYQYKNNQANDEFDRKMKKVEFCKTELHFAAETGRVNIIATDEKPPPSNDFRKRRSAFVPIRSSFDKPITLFGESNKNFGNTGSVEFPTFTNDTNELDENMAATKSILKNKIPKPKPYLLGENMAFGSTEKLTSLVEDINYDSSKPTGVTLINRQLQPRRYSDDTTASLAAEIDRTVGIVERNSPRTNNIGPLMNDSLIKRRSIFEVEQTSTSNRFRDTNSKSTEPIKNKFKSLQLSPVPVRARTRELRDTDLTYFGINKELKTKESKQKKSDETFNSVRNIGFDDFNSVRLVQLMSNSVCNSEAESEPDYQNLPIKTNFAPIPTPRSRSKYGNNVDTRILNTVIEQETDVKLSDTRRSRVRRQDEILSTSSRSISEPPKINRYGITEKPRRHYLRTEIGRETSPTRSRNNYLKEESRDIDNRRIKPTQIKHSETRELQKSDESDPVYVNFSKEHVNETQTSTKQNPTKHPHLYESKSTLKNKHSKSKNIECDTIQQENECDTSKSLKSKYKVVDDEQNSIRKVRREKKEKGSESPQRSHQNSLKKKKQVQRTEKLSTPDFTKSQSDNHEKASHHYEKEDKKDIVHENVKEHRSRSSHRHNTLNKAEESKTETTKSHKSAVNGHIITETGSRPRTRRTSKDKTSERKDNLKTYHKLESKSPNNHYNSVSSRTKKAKEIERIPKTDSYKPSKRSEIVINYDDKNGTVSSVCKVNVAPGMSKRKKVLKEPVTETPKDKSEEKKYLRK